MRLEASYLHVAGYPSASSCSRYQALWGHWLREVSREIDLKLSAASISHLILVVLRVLNMSLARAKRSSSVFRNDYFL
jgi:hypothetical protein